MSQYNNHPYNNHVIKVKTKEHGAKVIKWWISQGVQDADAYSGNTNEKMGHTYIYYGLYDGFFDNRCVEYTSKCKIIELPEDSSSSFLPLQEEKLIDWRSLSLEDWLTETKKLNLSLSELREHILNGSTCNYDRHYSKLEGEKSEGKATLLLEKWGQETQEIKSTEPSIKKEITKDAEYYKSFIGREVVGIDKFTNSKIVWNRTMKRYVGIKGYIHSYGNFANSFRVNFPDGNFWLYPADLLIKQLESNTQSTTEIKIPAVKKVSTEIKPDLSKKIPEIKISLPEVKPKQIGRVLIEKVNIKI